jgi:hypothetical protein
MYGIACSECQGKVDHAAWCSNASPANHRLITLRQSLERAQAETERLEKEIERLENQPKDDFPDGAYLVIERASMRGTNAPGTSHLYRKINGQWHGRNGNVVGWESLLMWMTTESRVTYMVTELRELEF